MNKILVVILLMCAVFVIAGNAHATILFSDDFTGTTINTLKWTAETAHGTVAQNNEAIFTIIGNGAANTGVHLRSSNISVPAEAIEVDFTGLWRVASSTNTAAANMLVYNASDPSKFIRVEYGTWDDTLYFWDKTVQPGVLATYSRGHHLANLPFAFNFTDSGWSYYENGSLIKNFSSTFTHGTDDFYVKIGGWDYSNISNQIAYFDNIKITANVVPEPFTMSLMGLGLLGFGIIKKKRR